jgi:hypothetical protein
MHGHARASLRLRAAVLGVLGPVVWLGCEVQSPHDAVMTSSLRMHGTPPDAMVTIDEQLVGPLAVVAARGVALRPGTHQVTVEAAGFFPMDRLVESSPATTPRIDLPVELVPVPR